MLDISIVWQKIKLVFSFFKFPSLIAQKIAFLVKIYKFKKLSKDKQNFLFDIYTTKHRTDVAFFNNNETLLRCLKIDGFIEYEFFPDEWTQDRMGREYIKDEHYQYNITTKYYKIVECMWRKSKKEYFKKYKLDYKYEEDIPF
jgi:hypothetical protein